MGSLVQSALLQVNLGTPNGKRFIDDWEGKPQSYHGDDSKSDGRDAAFVGGSQTRPS
jgi:hypothetical protein